MENKILSHLRAQINDYLAMMIVSPLFLVTLSSLKTVFITTQLKQGAENYTLVETASPFIYFILKLFPFFLELGLIHIYLLFYA